MNHEAIRLAYPSAKTIDDTAGVFDFDGKKIEIDQSLVDEKIAQLNQANELVKYQRDRAVAYDPIPEQLDQIYHDMDGWKAKVKAVKDKFPKP